MMQIVKIIINADDYGLNANINKAVIDSFSKGLCSSATIMATGGAFEDAVELAQANHFSPKIGIHLNLTHGQPLTESIRKLQIFCNGEGYFSGEFTHKSSFNAHFSQSEKTALAIECKAQIQKCRKAGLSLSHADSHYHVHTRWDVWQVAESVFTDAGITKVRISRNCGRPIPFVKRLYKLFLNKWLLKDFHTTEFFGDTIDAEYFFDNIKNRTDYPEASFEIMVHPIYIDGALKDAMLKDEDFRVAVGKIPGWQQAIAYTDL
jgi:predicted glycoside hydrolase/deacetylase ChbG (UPF0249 family)